MLHNLTFCECNNICFNSVYLKTENHIPDDRLTVSLFSQASLAPEFINRAGSHS